MGAILKLTSKKIVSTLSKAAELERKYYSELEKAVNYLRTPNRTLVMAVATLEKLSKVAQSQGKTIHVALAEGMFDHVLQTYKSYSKGFDFGYLKDSHELSTLKLRAELGKLGKPMANIERYHAEKFKSEILPLQAFESLLFEKATKNSKLLAKLNDVGIEKGSFGESGKSLAQLRNETEVNRVHMNYLSANKAFEKALESPESTPEKLKRAKERRLTAITSLMVIGRRDLLIPADLKTLESAEAAVKAVEAPAVVA